MVVTELPERAEKFQENSNYAVILWAGHAGEPRI
jgi:hypothetical protein